MSQALTLFLNLFVYSDGIPTNSPSLRDFDWSRRLSDIPTSKSRSQQHIVSAGETDTVLALQRPLTTGASWTITNPEGVASRWTWLGVNPMLRTERTGSALTTSSTVTIVRQANSTVVKLTFSDSPGTAIVAGDEIYIGASSGLSLFNQGVFSVVAAGGTWVEVLSSSMVNEVDTIADPTAIYAYSSGPVRVGDYVNVSNAAFSFGNRGEYTVTTVTSRFFEVQNSNVIPEGPITADVVVYDQLYKLTYLETDQPVNVYINGAAVPLKVEPIQEGQCGMVGMLLWRGPVYALSIENVGYNPANITTLFTT